jgi:hypothetical protein
MGTRSLTVFNETEKNGEICVMYRQFDGYPSGHGKELKNLLKDMVLVNGIPVGDNRKLANGMGCLAAQVVSSMKDGPGGIYIHPKGTRDCGEEYIYTLYPIDEMIGVKVEEVHGDGKTKTLYNGPIHLWDIKDNA